MPGFQLLIEAYRALHVDFKLETDVCTCKQISPKQPASNHWPNTTYLNLLTKQHVYNSSYNMFPTVANTKRFQRKTADTTCVYSLLTREQNKCRHDMYTTYRRPFTND